MQSVCYKDNANYILNCVKNTNIKLIGYADGIRMGKV